MDSEYIPESTMSHGEERRRRRVRSRRRLAVNAEDNEKKRNRNMTESRRVWKINEQYDQLVVMLGGVVNGAKRSRVWEKQGKEGKLRKLDILEATSMYIQRLVVELEEVKSGDIDREVSSMNMLAHCCPNAASAMEHHSLESSTSPVELGCQESIPDDILADDESDVEMTQLPPEKPHPPVQTQIISERQQTVDVFTFSPDDLQGCLQPTQNLYKAALNTLSPGENLLPSSTVSAHPPEISPELFKLSGFPHFVLSCQDFCGFEVPPLSPGEGMASYLADSPYNNGPPLY